MASEKKMNDSTSLHQSDSPILCANGCGFFGTSATMNLCSKCYRDSNMREEQAVTAMAAVEKSMTSAVADGEPAPVVLPGSSSSQVAEMPADMAPKSLRVKAPNRCGNCNKKVGVTGFRCKCGTTFCGSHRYPEEHCCTFDFKGAGKDAIAKANPVVKADKMDKF